MRYGEKFCVHLIISILLFGAVFLLALPDGATATETKNIILATTTSTQDSGLLDELLPVFQQQTGFFVKTIAVGSGQAMAMGARGEADVLLVHSPDAEKKFMVEDNGSQRRLVMHNDFVIVGPASDPAGVRSAKTAAKAFSLIAAQQALFMSRGDNSGTHAREKKIWAVAGLKPDGRQWYQQTGLGMGRTLGVAAEKKAYTLADRATYLALQKNLGIPVLSEGDAILLNVYHVIEVNAGKWPKVNAAGAKSFADFMVSDDAQKRIGSFGIEKFGSPLFTPDAGKTLKDLGL
jgi:tungstate transport system substrate-binding protein